MSFEEIVKMVLDYGGLIGFGIYLVYKDLKFTEKINDLVVLMNDNIRKIEELIENTVNNKE